MTDAAGQITWNYMLPALPASFPLFFECGVLAPGTTNLEPTAPVAIATR